MGIALFVLSLELPVWLKTMTPVVVPGSLQLKADHEDLLYRGDFPDWDYRPGEDDAPFEYKASDWGRLKDGRLVALDYSTPAHLTKEDLEELLCAATWPE
jgi:hypothetical protein